VVDSSHLKKITDTYLGPKQGESSGYITRQDLVDSFTEVFEALKPLHVLTDTSQATGGQSLLTVLMGMKFPAVLPSNANERPSKVNEAVQLLNTLIDALSEAGLVDDKRGQTAPPATPPASTGGTPVIGLVKPAAGSKVWTFNPSGPGVGPKDFDDLLNDPTVGESALAKAAQASFGTNEYLVLPRSGQAVKWDGNNNWWLPFIDHVVPPAPGEVEWKWGALGWDTDVLNTLLSTANAPNHISFSDKVTRGIDTHVEVGDGKPAMSKVDFPTGEYILLGPDPTANNARAKATYAADSKGTGFKWQDYPVPPTP
jgi:hypothetical protein